jgi:hypothetical protein
MLFHRAGRNPERIGDLGDGAILQIVERHDLRLSTRERPHGPPELGVLRR